MFALYLFGAAEEKEPLVPGRSDDHLRTLKIVKLPLVVRTTAWTTRTMTPASTWYLRRRSWKYNRYNKYNSYSPSVPTTIPRTTR